MSRRSGARTTACRRLKSVTSVAVARCSPAKATIARAIGCSDSVSSPAVRRSTSGSLISAAAANCTTRGVPSVSVPVLSNTTVSIDGESLERLTAFDQNSGRCAASGRDHDRRRHGQSHRARAGDDQHRDRGRSARGRMRARPAPASIRQTSPRRSRAQSARTHWRCDRPVAESAPVSPAPLSSASTMRARTLEAPIAVASMSKAPDVLIVAPITRSPGTLLDRQRFAGEHRFIDGA